MGAACGVRGKVVKRRQIYLYHNVRIHLDTVEGLGTFVEFEAVMGAAEEEATSRQRLQMLAGAMEIGEADVCSGSYCDLLGL